MPASGLPRLAAIGGCMAAALGAGHAQAQLIAPGRPTNMPGVTTSAEPPKHFDPLTANDEQLNAYGFPPRPNQATNPNAYANWSHAVGAHPKRLVPKLQQTIIYHGPRIAAARPATVNGSTSNNWSGYAADTGAKTWSNASFNTVAADFVVPAANARTCDSNWEYSSSWVGIDGYASSDVLQAGVEADVVCSGSYVQTYYAPWYEWYPNASTRITNLTATPGQSFYVHVWATSQTAGHAYLQNLTTDESVSLNFTAPSGTELLGESAEWILEAPTINSSLATLPLYGLDYFSAGTSTTLGKNVFTPGSVGATSIALVQGGTTYSTAGLLGTGGILLTSQ